MKMNLEHNWGAEDETKELTALPTPKPLTELLQTAYMYGANLAISPYIGCCMVFDGLSPTALTTTRYFGVVVPSFAATGYTENWLRGAMGQTVSDTPDPGAIATTYDKESYTATGGMTGNDIVLLRENSGYPLNYRYFGYNPPHESISLTPATYVTAPDHPLDRAYEARTLTTTYVEEMMVTYVASIMVF
jgi:hypothetical protein